MAQLLNLGRVEKCWTRIGRPLPWDRICVRTSATTSSGPTPSRLVFTHSHIFFSLIHRIYISVAKHLAYHWVNATYVQGCLRSIGLRISHRAHSHALTRYINGSTCRVCTGPFKTFRIINLTTSPSIVCRSPLAASEHRRIKA